MLRWLIGAVAAAALGASALAAPSKPSAAQSQQARINAIWDAVYERLTSQEGAWFDKGEFPKLVNLLRIHNSLKPNDYEVATNLGWMLENVENWDEALAVYVRYKNQNPNDPDGPYPEANFYFTKKLYAKVPPLLEPTLARNPHGNSYRRLAHAYERLNLLHDARRVWEAFLQRFPEDGAAKVNLQRVISKIKK